ncbi:nucleoporin NUP35-like [Ylistrum balloti]|uniref:nucleoporin NUP35-like n=1 Tax=Ylistrum balloti TaxID=509963 RepID=UPI002905A010|nr:nucleoporin NUP35-like [Ylistrum balloti]
MHSPSVEVHGTGGFNSFSMEPMMMGSPGSPTSPTGGHQSQFLPSFLLGDQTPHSVSPGPRIWSAASPSPPKSASRAGLMANSFNTSGMSRGEVLRPKEKVGAPPTKSLMGHASPVGTTPTAFGTPNVHQVSRSMHTPGSMTSTPAPPTTGLSQTLSESLVQEQMAGGSRIPISPAQLDPFYTQGESLTSDDILDETWVTVFGFPPAAASYILQQFSQYGNILKHVVASEGNWMHLHYQSKLQAKKALSKNGKVFGGCMMVGATPCIEKSVMEEEKENTSLIHPVLGTPGGNTTFHTPGGNSRNTPIRPLTAAYRTARSENEVVMNGQAPQKNNTFVSKAMEYMFGW